MHDRLGRPPVYALGIDEGSVVLVEPDGTATVRVKGKDRGAYLVRMTNARPLTPNAPLRATVAVAHVARDGERFDLAHHRASEPWRAVTVDGRRAPPYDADPYR